MAEALSAQIEHYRSALDHRSLFSAGYNRKLVRRIEILDSVREEFLVLSHELQAAEREVLKRGYSNRFVPFYIWYGFRCDPLYAVLCYRMFCPDWPHDSR